MNQVGDLVGLAQVDGSACRYLSIAGREAAACFEPERRAFHHKVFQEGRLGSGPDSGCVDLDTVVGQRAEGLRRHVSRIYSSGQFDGIGAWRRTLARTKGEAQLGYRVPCGQAQPTAPAVERTGPVQRQRGRGNVR